MCDWAGQAQSANVCAVFCSTRLFKCLILCFIFWYLFFLLLWGSPRIHGRGEGCELASGAEGAVLAQWREAPVGFLPHKEENKMWPRGRFAVAFQEIITAEMFLSRQVQSWEGQTVPQGKNFTWTVPPRAGHPKDSPISNIFYKGCCFLPRDGNQGYWQLISFRSSSSVLSSQGFFYFLGKG